MCEILYLSHFVFPVQPELFINLFIKGLLVIWGFGFETLYSSGPPGNLLCRPCWLQTQRSACLHLLSTEIKGLCYHAQPSGPSFLFQTVWTGIVQ